MKSIIISSDFSEYPGLRHSSISERSGEEFYHKILNDAFSKAYEEKEKLHVDLDFTEGYAPSFLDEAFGNLVYDFSLEVVKKYIEIKSEQEPNWKEIIEGKTYENWENRRLKGDAPKITEEHGAWNRLEDGELKSKIWGAPN